MLCRRRDYRSREPAAALDTRASGALVGNLATISRARSPAVAAPGTTRPCGRCRHATPRPRRHTTSATGPPSVAHGDGARAHRPSGSPSVGPWSASASPSRHRGCPWTEGLLVRVARTHTGGPSSLPDNGRPVRPAHRRATGCRRPCEHDRTAPCGHALAVARTLPPVVLAHNGGPVGFPGSRPVRSVTRRAASLALATALVLPMQGIAAAPSTGLTPATRLTPAGAATSPAVTGSDARPTTGRSWIVVLDASTLTPDGGSDTRPPGYHHRPGHGQGSGPGCRQRHRPSGARRCVPGDRPLPVGDAGLRRTADLRARSQPSDTTRLSPGWYPIAPVSVEADTWPSGVRRVNGPAGETSGVPDTDVDIAVIDTGIGPVGGPTGHECRAEHRGRPGLPRRR